MAANESAMYFRKGFGLKADVQGSLEAVTEALRKIDQEHEEVRLSFVHRDARSWRPGD